MKYLLKYCLKNWLMVCFFFVFFCCWLFVSRSTQPFLLGVDSFFFSPTACLKQIPVFKVGAWFSGFFLPLMIYSLYSSPLAALADLQRDHVEPIFHDSPDLPSLPFWLIYYVLGLLWGLLCCPLLVVCQTSLLPLLGMEWILQHFNEYSWVLWLDVLLSEILQLKKIL